MFLVEFDNTDSINACRDPSFGSAQDDIAPSPSPKPKAAKH